MAKETTRDVLLEAGRRVFLERGYNHSGIDTILNEAGVPKGRFYYYFESKEDFGLQVLNRFAERHGSDLDRILGDKTLAPLTRLRRLVEVTCERLESQQCRNGCLVGNLSQEMADQSEAFRARLDEILRGWSALYAGCLKEAQDAGDLAADLDVGEMAEFLLNSWQGAVLRAKTTRSTAPLRTFLNLIFGFVLKK
jgi:TetR/AcrR family transcriptional regulator, transcriptional repressor for nem operon